MASALPNLWLPSRREGTATAPWLVLMSHPAEGGRLNRSKWLVTCQDCIPANGRVVACKLVLELVTGGRGS